MADKELYYSNNGKGPMVARIVARRPDGTLIMERRVSENKGRWYKFELHEKLLLPRSRCGWKKRKATSNP